MFTPEQFSTASLHDPRVLRILAAAFNAVDPYIAVKKYLNENPISKSKGIFALGLGKAAIKMTQALADSIPLTDTLIITKHASPLTVEPATVIEGNHPVPGRGSLKAGRAALDFVSKLTSDDLLICLISGGGSALMTTPVIPLDELQSLTSALLASGARIDEINTIRRHLDSLKGGGLAQAANGAQIISMILSDVVGDSIEAIASGPTAPDQTTVEDSQKILLAYKVPVRPINFKETLKPNDLVFHNAQNQIVASNLIALQAAKEQAEYEGFNAQIVNDKLQGEAREVGCEMAFLLKQEAGRLERPFCLLAGGETTVTIKGGGKGGRNQEIALGALQALDGTDNVLFISIATDGEDGPTDAAGAVATNWSAQRAARLGVDAADHLSRNDAYPFFDRIGDLIKTGPSGTNVNDLLICIAQ